MREYSSNTQDDIRRLFTKQPTSKGKCRITFCNRYLSQDKIVWDRRQLIRSQTTIFSALKKHRILLLIDYFLSFSVAFTCLKKRTNILYQDFCNKSISVQCYDVNKTAKECRTNTCVYTYHSSEDYSNQFCAPQAKLPHSLEITTQIDAINNMSDRWIVFRCNYIKCNSDENIRKLHEILENYHKMPSLQKNSAYISALTTVMKTTTISLKRISKSSSSSVTTATTPMILITKNNVSRNDKINLILSLFIWPLCVLHGNNRWISLGYMEFE